MGIPVIINRNYLFVAARSGNNDFDVNANINDITVTVLKYTIR